jgi:hypothetical protein
MVGRRKQVLAAIESARVDGGIDSLALFCHGWSSGIQAGFAVKDIPELVNALGGIGGVELRVALYCCSTGEDPRDNFCDASGTDTRRDSNPGDGSFADHLRDELCRTGHADCSVFAHRTAGHTTRNPNVIIFEGSGSSVGGFGGVMPITPKNKAVWKAWVNHLKTPYRFEVSHLTVAEIREQFESIS